jgi:hypothetical protein
MRGYGLMNLRTLKVGLPLLAVFLLSFGIMWKPRKGDHTPMDERETVTTADATARTASPAVPVEEPRDLGRPAPEATESTLKAAAGPSAGAAPERDPAADDLPIDIRFRQRPDLGRIQGSIINKSNTQLVIDAVIFDPKTRETSKVQLDVAPYSGRPFGADDGLDMQSGDQITLRSAPYRDKLARIP